MAKILTLLVALFLRLGAPVPGGSPSPLVTPAVGAERLPLIYVAPNGNDRWSGRLAQPSAALGDGPLASLEGARDAVRRLKNRGPLVEPVHIVVLNGTYTLSEPIVFANDDSGTAQAPIIYEAAPGAHPVFTGGRRITGFTPGRDGIWEADVRAVTAGRWYFEQLFVNGRRAIRARSPNKFYYHMSRPADRNPKDSSDDTWLRRAFRANTQDVAPLLYLPSEQLGDVVVVSYFSWETGRQRVATIDSLTNTVVLKHMNLWPLFSWEQRPRYYLENFKEALDAPGEWFLDRAETLYYKPPPGEDMHTAEVIAPIVEDFVRFQGADHIMLKGLAFYHGGYSLPPGGYASGQAANPIGAAITVHNSGYIAIEDCEIAHIGRYAISLAGGSHDNTISRCHLHDLGAGGIKIDGQGNNTVDNNVVHSGGHLFDGAVGVWVGPSGGNTISHNDIADFRYTGISLGWSWGYGPSPAKRNIIEWNHIHHVGQGVLSDLGGVYTLGLSEGTKVRNNVVHDVYSYFYGFGWGLYADEGSTGIVFEHNLVYNTKGPGFHQHYGRDNVVRNNIFAFGMDGQVRRSRAEAHHSFDFQNNIVYWRGGTLLVGQWWDKNFGFERNVFYDASGTPVTFNGLTLDEWQKSGRDFGSLTVDPKFIDLDHYDFRLAPDSPALALGFKPFEYTQAGVYGNSAWVALARNVQVPPLEFAPPPPPPTPLVVRETFEELPVGALPVDAATNVLSHLVSVTEAAASGGKHGLRVLSVPGFGSSNFYYLPYHNQGTTRNSFDIRIEADTVMSYEWRDDGYRIGPCFSIENAQLRIGNSGTPVPLPTQRWIHLEVMARLGSPSAGTWDLIVVLPGQAPRLFSGLRNLSAAWTSLYRLDFEATATAGSNVFYLDNIELTNVVSR